jgi:hypothetical protein
MNAFLLPLRQKPLWRLTMYDFAGLGRQLMHRPRHRVGNQLFSATIYHFFE